MEIQSLVFAQNSLNVFRGVAFESPTLEVINLLTNIPNDIGVGTSVAGGGYTPKTISPSYFGSADKGVIKNSIPVDWEFETTAEINLQGWQLICDGDIWFAGHLNEGAIIPIGGSFYFDTLETKNLTISLNPQGGLPKRSTWEWMNRRLNVLKGASLTPPSQFKIDLSTTVPTKDGIITPVTASGYEAAVYGCDMASWSDPASSVSGREIENLLRMEFPKFEADVNSEIKGFTLSADVVPKEEIWYFNSLAPGLYGFTSDIFYILPGGIKISV